MSGWLRFAAMALVGLSCWSAPLRSQAQASIQYSVRSETRLAGMLRDPAQGPPVSFAAATEDGALTIRLDLESQSVTVRKGRGELHIDSSRNAGRAFSTLSDRDRQVIGQLVALMDEGLQTTNAFYAATLCILRHLSAWPTGMPLAVSVDALMKTVGDVSVPTQAIAAARRRAMAEIGAQAPGDTARDWLSLCKTIGRTWVACYPKSLDPYEEKCEKVLAGGTTCRGRCGTTCTGLCSEQRYTQDCHNHDRCADVYGLTDFYCDFIFPNAFDDCTDAPDCVDVPGVWEITYKFTKYPGSTQFDTFYIFANKKLRSKKGATGTWVATDTRITLTIGTCPRCCWVVFSAALGRNRLFTVGGTMRACNTNSGVWFGKKTDAVLPKSAAQAERGRPSAASDPRVDTTGREPEVPAVPGTSAHPPY